MYSRAHGGMHDARRGVREGEGPVKESMMRSPLMVSWGSPLLGYRGWGLMREAAIHHTKNSTRRVCFHLRQRL